MALNLSKDYTFAANTTIASAEVNTDYDELYNAFSGLEATTSTFAKLKVDVDPAAALEVATAQYVDKFANYRRPNLVYVSATAVDVFNNTGTANQTRIVFPDGAYRSVTEDTAVTDKYRRFIITATAEFTSGTEESGLYTGLTEATNTWYAIYAVKSTINTANFVLVGTTTLPVQGSVSTLNTNLGTNGWVYLGLIRNGDNAGTTGDILDFEQAGLISYFRNIATGNSRDCAGIRVATSAGATSLTYTFANGTGAAQIPIIVSGVFYTAVVGTEAVSAGRLQNSAGTKNYLQASNAHFQFIGTTWVPQNESLKTSSVVGGSVAQDIFASGWMDRVLSAGSNPFI